MYSHFRKNYNPGELSKAFAVQPCSYVNNKAKKRQENQILDEKSKKTIDPDFNITFSYKNLNVFTWTNSTRIVKTLAAIDYFTLLMKLLHCGKYMWSRVSTVSGTNTIS